MIKTINCNFDINKQDEFTAIRLKFQDTESGVITSYNITNPKMVALHSKSNTIETSRAAIVQTLNHFSNVKGFTMTESEGRLTLIHQYSGPGRNPGTLSLVIEDPIITGAYDLVNCYLKFPI